MKTKLLTALKTEYAKSGLSDKAFDGVASVLVKTVTKEDEIDGVVKSDETKALIKAYQTDTDKVRTEKANLQAEFDKYKQEHPETNVPPKKEDDEKNKELLARIAALEKENKDAKEKAARTEKLANIRAKMKEQGSDNDNILDLVLDKAEFKEEDKVDDIAATLKSAYDAKYTQFYGDGPVPRAHKTTVPEYTGKEDDDFAEELRRDGKLPKKEE
ncbi:MAG: hypothetical protein ACI3ZT_00910 [Candidatus Cryptobacteroides sp.]